MRTLSVKYRGNGGAIPDKPFAAPRLLLYVAADLFMDTNGFADPSWTQDDDAILFSDTTGSIWEISAYGHDATLFAGLQALSAFGEDVIAVIDDPSSMISLWGGAIDENIEITVDLAKLLAMTEASVAELETALANAGIDIDPDDHDDQDTNFVLIFNANL